MKQVLKFFTSSMASAPIKVPDVDAVSSSSNKSNHPFPLSTIEETRDEDELENSLVKVEEEAIKTARYLRRKQDTMSSQVRTKHPPLHLQLLHRLPKRPTAPKEVVKDLVSNRKFYHSERAEVCYDERIATVRYSRTVH